ncbi:MAG TPA: ABC transporter substrate-binding protein, partial [Candidatus Sulfotelmatobacter sp.]|nr:ABC transporter substrate-binding protein [Candidatus Sulfotelmatobacter sp.]
MRRWTWGVAGVLGVLGLLVGGTIAPAQVKPLKLGQTIPITGEAAEAGKYHRQGAELAVEQTNAGGGIKGRKLQLVLEDDQTSNPGAVAALQKLLE